MTAGVTRRAFVPSAALGYRGCPDRRIVYINSFNERHEGREFEPMTNRSELTAAERALGYHNADHGPYRLDALRGLIEDVMDGRERFA